MVHPIMILIVDLNSSKERKEEGMEGHTDRQTDGQTERSEIFFLRRWDKSRFYEGGTNVVF
jgi:hypothetical protein